MRCVREKNSPGGNFINPHDDIINIIADISAYFKYLKNMGLKCTDISPESKKIIQDMDIINKSVSQNKKSISQDELIVKKIERQTNVNLSLLSLQGQGSLNSELFFIMCDESPLNENTKKTLKRDAAGIYQGESGKLFLKILKAMHLDKNCVYTSFVLLPDCHSKSFLLSHCSDISSQKDDKKSIITNTLQEQCLQQYHTDDDKCKALLNEFNLCIRCIKKQIDIIHPKIICCLGEIAAKALFGKNHSIEDLRGKFHNYNGAKIMATFDPGLLIIDETKKKYVWDDMQKIMAVLGI